MMRSSYRGSSSAYISSRLTQRDRTDRGLNISTNQRHLRSAPPIRSCHCCAPRRSSELYQTGTPYSRSSLANLSTNGRSFAEFECERNILAMADRRDSLPGALERFRNATSCLGEIGTGGE